MLCLRVLPFEALVKHDMFCVRVLSFETLVKRSIASVRVRSSETLAKHSMLSSWGVLCFACLVFCRAQCFFFSLVACSGRLCALASSYWVIFGQAERVDCGMGCGEDKRAQMLEVCPFCLL